MTVTNDTGYALPDTGGPGTERLSLLGLVITVVSGTGLMLQRKLQQNRNRRREQ
jgi:hypothetical protein